MKRWQRKQRLKEMKKAQKEARKRKQAEATSGADAGPALADGVTSAQAALQPDGPVAQTILPAGTAAHQPVPPETRDATAGVTPAPDGGPEVRAPKLLPAYGVEEAGKEVALNNAMARGVYAKSGLVSEIEAAEMLSFAARQLSDVIDAGHRALRQVSPQRLREATEVLNEKSSTQSAGGMPTSRPRRGTDPVVTLMKLMVQAVSLLQRMLNRLHPKLRRAA